MQIGYIGLGKMGLAQVERLLKKGYRVVAWNRSAGPRETARKLGAEVNGTLQEVCRKIKKPRLLWLMVPHAVVDDIIQEIVLRLSKGDTVIDGGNSFYKDSMRRAKELSRKGINFLDVGTSGGPFGALNGACLMIGGNRRVFRRCEPLFRDLSAHLAYSIIRANNGISSMRSKKSGTEEGDYAYAYIGKNGAGHFVKMVHNGIEYGMMQAIGEGFAVLKKSQFALDLQQIAELYNKGSVVESRLMGWLAKAFTEHGENLKDISGEVAHSGEGLWTVETAKELRVPVKVINDSLDFRLKSKGNPSYTGQVVSALRNQFGGHEVKKQ